MDKSQSIENIIDGKVVCDDAVRTELTSPSHRYQLAPILFCSYKAEIEAKINMTNLFPMRHMTCSTGSVMWSLRMSCLRVKVM